VAQLKKLPSFSFVSNSGQIWRAVQNGGKSDLPGHCSLRTSPACNKSLTGPIFMNFSHDILLSIPSLQFGWHPPHFFLGGAVKFWFFLLWHF